MEVGNRIYFNQNGLVLFKTGESSGAVTQHFENEIINYIDLPFGDKTLENAQEWHIDVEGKKIVVDKAKENIETEEEKLKREKQELENQLLLQANKELVGGIL